MATGDSRFETIANEIKEMKNSNNIPNELPIFIDLKRNFDSAIINLSVLPTNVTFINNAYERQKAIYEKQQSIIITTNRGNVDFFLKETISNSKYLIFYTNYVSKGCRADKLIRLPRGSTIILGKKEYIKMADVRKTEEYSEHDFFEGLIKMLQGFSKKVCIFLEHGDVESKEELRKEIQKIFPNTKTIILERNKAYRILENAIKGTK